jgi:hypothetical protein
MERITRVLLTMIFLAFIVVSCNQDDQTVSPESTDQNLSEIARLEKEEGVALFKKDFVFEDGKSKATLTMATRSEVIFKNVIEKYEIVITPLYEELNSSKPDANSILTKPVNVSGEEVLVEFTQMERGVGVIGFKTDYHLKGSDDLSNGKTQMEEYPYYVNHYSGHWPSKYQIYWGVQGGGLHFYARWKWYQGYGTRTVCLVNSSTCADDWDVYGNATWTFDVDGPYQMQVKIGYQDATHFSDTWIY